MPRKMMALLCVALALVQIWPVIRAQTVEEMVAKLDEEKEARAEARMAAQMRMMGGLSGEGDLPDLEVPGEKMPAMTIPKAPKQKQISVKKARAFMKEALAALTTPEAHAALKAARERVDPKVEDYWQTLTNALGPSLEKCAREVVLKYGFAKDFEQAMSSVGYARERKKDKELTAAMEQLNVIFTGRWESTGQKELSALARRFLKLDEAGRRSALVEAESLRAKLPADAYVAVMRGILDDGEIYVKNAIVKVAAAAKAAVDSGRTPSQKEKDDFDFRMGALLDFLPPEEKAKLLDLSEDENMPKADEL